MGRWWWRVGGWLVVVGMPHASYRTHVQGDADDLDFRKSPPVPPYPPNQPPPTTTATTADTIRHHHHHRHRHHHRKHENCPQLPPPPSPPPPPATLNLITLACAGPGAFICCHVVGARGGVGGFGGDAGSAGGDSGGCAGGGIRMVVVVGRETLNVC